MKRYNLALKFAVIKRELDDVFGRHANLPPAPRVFS